MTKCSFFSAIRMAAIGAIVAATPALADVTVTDAYARASRPNAPTGAAFMQIISDADDQLIAVTSDVAKRVELHTHVEKDDGVMQMRQIEAGIELTAGAAHHLRRGGDHVMLMGLTRDFVTGETFTVTLTFKNAGDVVIVVPIDNDRKPSHSH
jgi:copper(I)-binding protein